MGPIFASLFFRSHGVLFFGNEGFGGGLLTVKLCIAYGCERARKDGTSVEVVDRKEKLMLEEDLHVKTLRSGGVECCTYEEGVGEDVKFRAGRNYLASWKWALAELGPQNLCDDADVRDR